MLKPKGVEPVDWEKIYLNEDEFLEVESSIGSQEESEGEVPQGALEKEADGEADKVRFGERSERVIKPSNQGNNENAMEINENH